MLDFRILDQKSHFYSYYTAAIKNIYGCLPEQVTEEVGVLSNSLSELVRAAGDYAKYDRRAIHEHWRNGFTYTDMAAKYAGYYERILDGEDLHPQPIRSPVVRQKTLFDWLP